jgi:hypothetical protein
VIKTNNIDTYADNIDIVNKELYREKIAIAKNNDNCTNIHRSENIANNEDNIDITNKELNREKIAIVKNKGDNYVDKRDKNIDKGDNNVDKGDKNTDNKKEYDKILSIIKRKIDT